VLNTSIVSLLFSNDNKHMDINLSPERYEPMMTADAYYFYALEPEITEGHIGQRVVIKNCRVVGYFNSTMEAMGYMGDNGHEIGTFSVHDCGECENEAKFVIPNPDDWSIDLENWKPKCVSLQ
jgi:hypothetical protein